MIILTLLPAALGAEPHLHADLSTLSPQARAEALYTSFEQHFVREGQERWACGTGVVMALREHWADFSPAQRARMNGVLVPWGGDLLDPIPARPDDGAAPPPAGTDTCFAQVAPNRLVTAHFAVDYEDGVSESIAEAFGNYLEDARAILVDHEGWTPVINDSRYLMMAYISADSGDGAYTTVEYCDKGGWMPYMVAYQNVFSDKAWAKEMAAHEYNHAQQYSYSFAHEFWFWEATATWIEDLVYPTSDGWADYVNGGYAAYPFISMRASSQRNYEEFYHMYGMAIFVNYLEEHVGGKELVRGLWEDAETDYSQYGRTIEEALTERELDFYEVYDGFILNSTVMEYEDQDELSQPRRQTTVGSLPAGDTYDNDRVPEGLGQNFLSFKTDITTEDAPDLLVRFSGDPEADSWLVRLVGVRDEAVAEVVELEVVSGVGEGTLESLSSFDEAWLVVAPIGSINKAYDWGFEAEGVLVPDPDPIDNGDDSIDGDRPLDDGKRTCSSAPGAGAWPLGLLGLGLALRRRRG